MKKSTKFIIIFLPILAIGLLIAYYFPYKTVEVSSSDQTCQVNEDCIMAMVECSCDCGVPINKVHWQKYLDRQEKKCKFYAGKMCKMACEQKLECVNHICTDIK